MSKKLRILNLEDNPADSELMAAQFEREGIKCDILRVETRNDFLRALEDDGIDLILADFNLPDFDGLSALDIAVQKCPDVPYIFLTGAMGEDMAIETLRRGAADYVLKDKLFKLGPAVRCTLKSIEERRARRKAEEALRESEERFRTVAESAADAVICLKEYDKVYFWNRKAELMFGYTAEEAMTANLHDLIVPESSRDRAAEGLRKFFATGEGPCVGKTVELAARRKDGTEFPVELSISAMNIHGEWHAAAICRDVTRRKKAEEKMKEQLDELLRFQKATIQREFRIKELKDRVATLESELADRR